jgi:hypothetical protein
LHFIPFKGIFEYGDIYSHHPQGGAQADTESAGTGAAAFYHAAF